LEFVCASVLCGDVFNLLHCMLRCLSLYKGREDKKRKFDHYFRCIRKRANAIASNPSLMVRLTAGEEPGRSEVRIFCGTSSPSLSGNWNGCGILTCARYKYFDNLEMDLMGHSEWVTSVSLNHDGSSIVSGSTDKTIKIWDGSNGELLHTLESHSHYVNSVSWNHDGSKLASGSNEETIKIWHGVTGELLNTPTGNSRGVMFVSWNHDGSQVVSGCGDKTIKIMESY
jgi:WD40 repeat protein